MVTVTAAYDAAPVFCVFSFLDSARRSHSDMVAGENGWTGEAGRGGEGMEEEERR
jgi:hypothetical protein